jgi:MYXO-CTERM domain-containing protein
MQRRKVSGTSGSVLVLSLGVSLILIAAHRAPADPIVDGRYDPSEGYALGWPVDFAVEKADGIVSGGALWLHEDTSTGDVFVAFVQPLALVDNTYGAGSIGWGPDAPSGKRHNFEDLLDSDRAQFVFTDASGLVVLDVVMDYISEADGGHRSLGVSGGDGAVNVGAAGSVLEWGTSLDYNFNVLGYVLTEDSPATDQDYTENPLFPGWVFEVTYELRVSGEAFGDEGFGGLTIPLVHDSPNKIGKGKVYPEPVPEPTAAAVLALGAFAALIRRRPAGH